MCRSSGGRALSLPNKSRKISMRRRHKRKRGHPSPVRSSVFSSDPTASPSSSPRKLSRSDKVCDGRLVQDLPYAIRARPEIGWGGWGVLKLMRASQRATFTALAGTRSKRLRMRMGLTGRISYLVLGMNKDFGPYPLFTTYLKLHPS